MELADDKLMFEGMVVEAEGYETTPEKDGQQGPIPDNLREAYIQFYQETIVPKLKQIPTHTVKFEEDELDLVFDLGLLEQLFDVYVTEGWAGIKVVEQSLLGSARTDGAALKQFMKGQAMVLNNWNYSVLFFYFTKNMLAMIIRDALVSMEKTASGFIYHRIMYTYGELASIWKKYDIQPYEKQTKTDSLTRGNDLIIQETRYKIGDEALRNDLAALMKTTLKASGEFLRQLNELMDVEQKIINLESTGRPNYSPSSTYEKDLQRRASLQTVKVQSEKLLGQLRQVMQKNHPVGMLLLPLLKEDCTVDELENTLGATLDTLRKEIELLSKQLNAQTNYTAQWMPRDQTKNIIKDVLSFKVSAKGPEAALLDMAMERFSDPGTIALLNEDVLIQLLNEEIISYGSMEYIVTYQYYMLLGARLEAKIKEEKEKDQFWTKIGMGSAGLSLASLLAGVALAPVLAEIAGLALIYHAVDSVGQALKQRETHLRDALLRNDGHSFQGMSRLGELVKIKKDVLDGLEGQLLIEFITMVATQGIMGAKGFMGIKKNLIRKSYLDDVGLIWDGMTSQE